MILRKFMKVAEFWVGCCQKVGLIWWLGVISSSRRKEVQVFTGKPHSGWKRGCALIWWHGSAICVCLVSHMALEWPYPGTTFLEHDLCSLENIMVQLPARLFFTFLRSALFFTFTDNRGKLIIEVTHSIRILPEIDFGTFLSWTINIYHW